MSFDEENFPSLPDTWVSVPIEEVCENVSVRDKVQNKSYLRTGQLAVVDQGSGLVGGFTDDTRKVVTKDLPVIVFGDHTRAIKYVDFPFAAGADGIKVLRPTRYMAPRVFYRFLQAIRLPDKGYARHFQHLRTARIALPPFNEQKRIAKKLDALLEQVDACRERLERVSIILRRFRQAVLAAATSGELTEEWRDEISGQVRSNQIEFDDKTIQIPETWGTFELSELIDPQRPLCYGVVQPGAEVDGGIPLIRVQDVGRWSVNTKALRTVSAEIDTEYRRSRVRPGDLLVSVVGTIGRTALVPEGLNANIARAIARVSSREGVHAQWINIWLSSNTLQWWLVKTSREVARKTLNLSELGETRVALPPKTEQDEIVRRVETLFAYADRLEGRYGAALEYVERLTPALLAKAFRGELVPQDPTDEPASSLLARIRAARPSLESRRNAVHRKITGTKTKAEETMLKREALLPTYLSDILKTRGALTAESLWVASHLDIDDFYDQLKDEEARGLLKETRGESGNTPRLLEAA